VASSDPAGASRLQHDLDGLSDQAFRSLDVLARALHVKDPGLEPALQAIVSTAARTVSVARHAGVIVISRGKFIPQAATGRPPQLLDELQQKLNEGPCVSAAEQQVAVRITDMSGETRWPGFAAEAESLKVRSMVCLPLWIHERCLGTLSLYAEQAGAFSGQDERTAALFATLAVIALSEAQRADQLRSALASRDLIGQGKGILMERHRVTAEAAFGLLSRASQNTNLKLTEVARQLAETGELPGQPDSAG
jgi:GAF domain-containing protein